LTLASGLTVSLLMWAVLWQAVLAPLPYRDSQHLYTISSEKDAQKDGISPVVAQQLPAQLPPGYGMTSFFWNGTTFLGGERPQVMTTLTVDANYFDVLGIAPFLGRGLLSSDADSKNIVLGEAVWRKYFNADPNIIGKAFSEEGGDSIIVGVVSKLQAYPAPDLAYFKAIDWAALQENPGVYLNARFLNSVLRTPNTRTGKANIQDTLNQANLRLVQSLGQGAAQWRLIPESFEAQIRGDLRAPLWALSGLSLLVLLISATNAAHLVLTRGHQRAAAFGVMDALGAPKRAIVKIIFLETTILAGASLLLAFIGCALIVYFSPNLADSGINIDPELGLRVLFEPTLALAAALLTGFAMLLAGAYPAARIWKLGASHALVQQRSGGSGKNWLGVPGIALSIAALFAAALFWRSAQQLQNQALGLDVEGTVAAQIFLNGERGDSTRDFAMRAAEMLAQAQKIPGAKSVAIIAGVPFNPVGNLTQNLENGPALAAGQVLKTNVRAVAGDARGALGYQLLAGRDLALSDSANASSVALINQRFALLYFGTSNPIGQSISIETMVEGSAASGAKTKRITVVGILGDARFVSPNISAGPEIWLPFAQSPISQNQLSVLVKGAPNAIKAVQESVWAVDPNQAIFRAYSVSEDLYRLSAAPRFFARFAGLFGMLSMLLAALGSYAILAFSVAERRREFALRSALGANGSQLLRGVMWENTLALLPGLLLGVCCAWALAQLLRAQVYGEFSPALLAAFAAAVVLFASLLSSYFAARPITQVALVDALKAN